MTQAPAPAVREQARALVGELALRLADIEQVVRIADAQNAAIPRDQIPCPAWDPASLVRGPGALALFFSELARTDPRWVPVSAEWVARTAAAAAPLPVRGATGGLGALATVLRVCHPEIGTVPATGQTPGSGLTLGTGPAPSVRDRVDARMGEHARWLARGIAEARSRGLPTVASGMDILSGLSGDVRHLLDRPGPALEEGLAALVSLAEPLQVEGVWVPGCWCARTERTDVGPGFEAGMLNLGLAHGVAGILSVLAVAQGRGQQVPGLRRAIGRFAEVLLACRGEDEHGPYWTSFLNVTTWSSPEAGRAPRPARASWCYGSLGIARALDLAAGACGEPGWRDVALDAVAAQIRRPIADWGVEDAMLCHGWAATIHLLGCFAELPAASALRDRLVQRVIGLADPELPFLFRHRPAGPPRELDLPGLLDGASGIGLVLDAYARDARPVTPWDSVLALS